MGLACLLKEYNFFLAMAKSFVLDYCIVKKYISNVTTVDAHLTLKIFSSIKKCIYTVESV